MRILFSSTQHPSNVARALRRALAAHDRRLSLHESKDLLARMYGYPDWLGLSGAAASTPLPSPFDHLVDAAEAAARRAQYRAALVAIGLSPEAADATIDAARPTALPDALEFPDLLAGAQAERLGLAAFDAAAFAGTAGGARLLRALRAAAADDPHWARRGALRARMPDDPWLVGALSDMRAAPTHRAWTPLALLCLAESARQVGHAAPDVDLAALRAALAAGDHVALAAPLDAMPTPGLLRLVAHAEDLLPALVAAHAPAPARHAPYTPPSRLPWRRRSPMDLSAPPPPLPTLTRGDLAELDLFVPGMPEAMLATAFPGRPLRDFRELHPAARAAGLDPLAGPAPASGPLERDDVLLAADLEGAVVAAVAVRWRADPQGCAYHLDVAGPFPVPRPPHVAGPLPDRAHAEAFLLAAALGRIEDDLRSWGRAIPPGGRLSLFATPADGPSGAFARRLARIAAERHALAASEMPELGFALAPRNAAADGSAAPLPDLHLARVPPAAAKAWDAFERDAARVARATATPVVARLRHDGSLDLNGADGRPIAGRGGEADAAHDALCAPSGVDAVRHVVAEAGLGPDAAVMVFPGFTAVLSGATLADRDWRARRGICLVVGREPASGERERLTNRFWAAFPAELDAIRAASATPRPSPAHLVEGPARPQ